MVRMRIGGLLILGIDAENVKRLKKNLPIHLAMAEVETGKPVREMIIMYGDTIPDIVKELKANGVLPPDFVPPVPTPAPRH